MADQSAFAVTTERIDTPVYRVTVGWGDMGRTWILSLPGAMTPDAVEHVVQTMRRVVGAAVEEERRRYGEQLDELHRGYMQADEAHAHKLAKVTDEREHAKDALHHVRGMYDNAHCRANVQQQLAEDRGIAVDILGAELEERIEEIGDDKSSIDGLCGESTELRDRLAAAHAEVERLTAERDALRAEGASWCDRNTKQIEHITTLASKLRRVTEERDALETKLAAAQRLWESMKADKAERDALKASKPAVPTCVECGGPLDTWCERCTTPDEAERSARKAGG